MSEVIGNVTFLDGNAVAVSADGTERVLALGDAIMSDEVVRTAEGARIEIALANGEAVAISGNDSWVASSAGAETAEMTGEVIGTVSSVSGQVVAVAADGSERVLLAGDVVYADEVIRTGPDAQIEIAMNVGGPVVLEGGQSWLATSDTYTPADQFDTSEAVADSGSFDDVDAIQAAILAGQDPTQIGEATAAGAPAAGATGGDDGGADFVTVNRTGNEVDPTAGYDTVGISSTVEQPVSEELAPLEELPTVSVSVEVSVDTPADPSLPGVPDQPTEEFPVIVSGNVVNLLEGTAEGEGEYKDVTFNLVLSQVYDKDVTVTYQLNNGTATHGEDWLDGDDPNHIYSVVIPAGETSIPVTIHIIQDSLVEGNETVGIVLLSADNATVNPDASSGTIVIFDDDFTTFSVTDASIQEGGLMTFTVTRMGDATFDQTVDFSTSIGAGDTAASSDFTATTGTLTFAPGETSKTFTVQTTADTIDEENETFTVSLSNPSTGALVSATDGSATGTILDDDSVSVQSVSDATEVEGTDLVHTVTMSGVADTAKTYSFSFSDVSATEGTDYDGTPVVFSDGVTFDSNTGLITVPAGVDSFTVTFGGLDDSIDETNETYSLNVGGVGATGTIVDNDEAPITYDGSDWQVNKSLIQPKGNGSITFSAGGQIHFDFFVTDPDAALAITASDLAALSALGLEVSITEASNQDGTSWFRIDVLNTTEDPVVITNSQKIGLEWSNVSSNLADVGFINSDEYVLLNNDGNSAPLITGSGEDFDAYDGDNTDVDHIWASSDPNGQEFVQTTPVVEAGETINGGDGNDIIYGNPGVNQANLINDTISGGAGNDIIDGRAGTDILNGDAGDDVIFGGYGNDTIDGGLGNDVLTGGYGEDVFHWDVLDADGGTDTVTDFNSHGEHDVLDLSDLLDPTGANVIDSGNISSYLEANFDSVSDTTTIKVYTNGDAGQGGAVVAQEIVVNGDVSDLATLVDNGSIVVDNS
ncbi:retention module-containing protein [Marinobacterium sp. D7]|uniref:retention module-containing protein n=1 Tax=Marinobacterium ramblicola TaxID=2849041 RepID=UPI001C2D8DDC|nr:retention module-containing protein [Marinobacterium ramblicola]MBV1788496.1 retention module-containing protein [Marinobacterium ramblicola]